MFLSKFFKKKKFKAAHLPIRLEGKLLRILKKKGFDKSKSDNIRYVEKTEKLYSIIKNAFNVKKSKFTDIIIKKISSGNLLEAEKKLFESIEKTKGNKKAYDFFRLALLKELLMEDTASEEFYKESLKINPFDALVLKSYANLLLKLQKPKIALTVFLKTLEEDKIRYGDKHPVFADTLSRIAEVYTILNAKEEKIFPYLKESLIINENAFGKFHIKTGESLKNIALFFANSKNKKNAIKYFEESLFIYEKNYGNNNIEIAHLMCHFGDLLKKLKDRQRALDFFEKSEKIYTNFFGKNDPLTEYLSFKKNLLSIK